jgi:trk system potassium uptake protein TrkA
MKIIVVGCGRLGSGLAMNLSRAGHTVTVIDKEPSAFELLAPSFKGNTIAGIGFDRDVLNEAGIKKVDAVVAVTSSDETNAVIARLASRFFRVPKVVARLYDQRKAEIYKRLGLQTVDPTYWGIKRMTDLICYSPLSTVLSVGDGGVEIVEVEIPTLLVGRKVSELTMSGEVRVVAISRKNNTFLPSLGTEFQSRDHVYLAVASSFGDRLKSLLGMA